MAVLLWLIPSSLLVLTSTLLYSYMQFHFRTIALVGAVTHSTSTQCMSKVAHIDLSWYSPRSNDINNLTIAINGTGSGSLHFDGSSPSMSTKSSKYNWCNMPHVHPQEYQRAPADFKLEYVEVIHRHHKRTPYAANTFPQETESWFCDDEALFYYGTPIPDGRAAHVNWRVYTSASNPFVAAGFPGTCQFPQVTSEGLKDSMQHGQDLASVYRGILGLLPEIYDSSKIEFRVTHNVITSQVAGQVAAGMFRLSQEQPFQVLIQPDSIDSLEPQYECAAADTLYSSYGIGSMDTKWLPHLKQSASLFENMDAVSGVNESDPQWHMWLDHYFDNLSARLCHNRRLPCSAKNSSFCITQAQAEAVFRLGAYEYSFIYRDSLHSLMASTASFGVWVAELASNIRTTITGSSSVIYRHNIAHDWSLSKLLSIMQVEVMTWPGMGAEVVFELYTKQGCWYVRVLWNGQSLTSSNPTLATMDMVPVEALLAYFDGLVGENAIRVPHLCSVST